MEGLDLPERAETSWRNFMADFEVDVWPWFQQHGYSKDAALLAWKLNELDNTMLDVLAELQRDH